MFVKQGPDPPHDFDTSLKVIIHFHCFGREQRYCTSDMRLIRENQTRIHFTKARKAYPLNVSIRSYLSTEHLQ